MSAKSGNRKDPSDLLGRASEALSGAVGHEYFRRLTSYLCNDLGMEFAFIGELVPGSRNTIRTLSLVAEGAFAENTEYSLESAPSQHVVRKSGRCIFPANVRNEFPEDQFLQDMGAEGYVGAPLISRDGGHLGIVAALSKSPIEEPDTVAAVFDFIALQASAEVERIQSNSALRESEARFREFAECSSDWFWEMDADLRVSYCSDRYYEIHGTQPERLLGKTLEEAGIAHRDDAAWSQHLEIMRAHQPFRHFVERRTKPDGTVIWSSISGNPQFDGTGKFTGYRGTGHDISQIKETEAALTRAKDEAEAVNDAKTEFLATMSHEIRTPMTGVLGMAKLLQISDLDAQQKHQVDTIINCGNALLDIVNDVLDLAQLESGKIRVEPALFHLRDFAVSVTELLAGKAEEKGLKLICQFADPLPEHVCADEKRIRQILINLIGNAVKFTAEGEVRLSISEHQGAIGTSLLRFDVTDTGIGIPAPDIARLFSKFEQMESSTCRDWGGSGLGLAIVKQLVDLFGGKVGVESEPGRGSRFWFTVPVTMADAGANADAATPSDAAYKAKRSLKLLVAEDNKVIQLILTAMLGRAGHRLDIVGNGEEALEAMRRADYDAVLMDVRMPKVDGFQATRKIRSLPGAKSGIPILAVTADAIPRKQNDFALAGFDGVVVKPISPAELFEKLDIALGEDIHGTLQGASPGRAAM